jgi:hypothetical protein
MWILASSTMLQVEISMVIHAYHTSHPPTASYPHPHHTHTTPTPIPTHLELTFQKATLALNTSYVNVIASTDYQYINCSLSPSSSTFAGSGILTLHSGSSSITLPTLKANYNKCTSKWTLNAVLSDGTTWGVSDLGLSNPVAQLFDQVTICY